MFAEGFWKRGLSMAGFLIAMLSGALMSIQGVFNTNVTKSSSIWVAAGFVQLTALLTCVAAWFCSGREPVSDMFNVTPKISLFGGVIGAFITYTVIRAMSELGVARAEITIVITQIAVAYLIELFGLFGTEGKEFSWMKLLGIFVAAIGLAIYSLCGNQANG